MKIYVTVLLFCVPLLCSCVKDDEKVTFSDQEIAIAKYVEELEESSGKKYETYNDGVWRVILEEGDGSTFVDRGSKILIEYYISTFNRGQLEQIYTNIGNPGYSGDWVTVGNNSILSGLDIGIVGASLNERCYVIFSARHGFGNTQVGIIPKMTALQIEVVIKDIINN